MFGLMIALATFASCEKESDKPADQTLEGGEVSGVWEKGSTITVNGHLTIPEGESLTIEEGVTVLMNDTAAGQEILVFGNLYCKGTESSPVKFTVPTDKIRAGNFPRIWGGILCSETTEELYLNYTIMEYTGYVTTEESPSVKAGLFKAEAGEGLPAINTKNVNGKVVVTNSTFRKLGEDCFYLEGGKIIIANNTIYTQGETGGDAINLKAGCIADVCINLVYR